MNSVLAAFDFSTIIDQNIPLTMQRIEQLLRSWVAHQTVFALGACNWNEMPGNGLARRAKTGARINAGIRQEQKGVGCTVNRNPVETILREFLETGESASPGEMLNLAMENIPIRRTQLNARLVDMRMRGIVRVNLPPRRRVPQIDTRITLA